MGRHENALAHHEGATKCMQRAPGSPTPARFYTHTVEGRSPSEDTIASALIKHSASLQLICRMVS